MSPFCILLELMMMEVVVTTGAIRHTSFSQIVTTNKPTPNILQAGYPSCRQTNSVRALKGESNAYVNFYLHNQMLMLTRGVFQPCLWPLKAPVAQLTVILFCFSALTLIREQAQLMLTNPRNAMLDIQGGPEKTTQTLMRYNFSTADHRVTRFPAKCSATYW